MTIADQILYEDNHLLALNKLPGQIAQGDKTGDTPLADLVKAYIKVRDAKPGNVFCGVIHRLDRPVSGVILFAKTSKALSRMTQLVKERDFSKRYWAVVKNAPARPAATLEDWLVKDEAHNKSRVVPEGTRGAKLASLDYRVVAGDLKYGAPRSNTDGSISLHARTLSFSHPVTHSQITITAPCPDIERMFNMTNN